MAKQKHYRPIEGGLKHTDNCPVCGQAMKVSDGTILGIPAKKVVCAQDSHNVTMLLRKDATC